MADGSDPVKTFERMTYLTGKAQQMMMSFWLDEDRQQSVSPDPFGIGALWPKMSEAAMADPMKLAQLQVDFLAESARMWQGWLGNLGPADDGEATPAAARSTDKRFKGEAWESIPAYQFIKDAYLLASRYLMEGVGALDGLTPAEKEKAAFFTRQFVDAMSPSNYLLTNPEVLQATIDSGGENLLRGTEHLLDDLKRGKMRMTDEDAFEVGVNVAATPGKVVFENRLFQLIQYTPTTDEQYEIPLVIFPPWINKFYILDLTAEKSFIRWCLEQKIAVYVVSWKNADETLADVELDDYVEEGFVVAFDKVMENTGAPTVNAIGYCVAGTTLAAVLAYLQAKGDADKVRTATFFTAQVDFEDAGDLKVFIGDDDGSQVYEQLAEGKGYLDGRYMATTFNLLRSNDLIWNYVVNNYLLGKDYFPFDLLYWNSDATNVPAKWHAAYLKDFYRDNKLAQPGGISVNGVPIDLRTVKTPTYVQAGKEDHIAPLPSVWKLTRHLSGPTRFVQAGSGHIAGVVNPPSAKKYQYWTLDGELPDSLAAFQEEASEHPGSWWPDWVEWLAPQSGKLKPALQPGDGKLTAIEDAPGRYVREKIG